jgi:hypothetical protein
MRKEIHLLIQFYPEFAYRISLFKGHKKALVSEGFFSPSKEVLSFLLILVLELFNASLRIHKQLLTGKKWV